MRTSPEQVRYNNIHKVSQSSDARANFLYEKTCSDTGLINHSCNIHWPLTRTSLIFLTLSYHNHANLRRNIIEKYNFRHRIAQRTSTHRERTSHLHACQTHTEA